MVYFFWCLMLKLMRCHWERKHHDLCLLICEEIETKTNQIRSQNENEMIWATNINIFQSLELFLLIVVYCCQVLAKPCWWLSSTLLCTWTVPFGRYIDFCAPLSLWMIALGLLLAIKHKWIAMLSVFSSVTRQYHEEMAIRWRKTDLLNENQGDKRKISKQNRIHFGLVVKYCPKFVDLYPLEKIWKDRSDKTLEGTWRSKCLWVYFNNHYRIYFLIGMCFIFSDISNCMSCRQLRLSWHTHTHTLEKYKRSIAWWCVRDPREREKHFISFALTWLRMLSDMVVVVFVLPIIKFFSPCARWKLHSFFATA